LSPDDFSYELSPESEGAETIESSSPDCDFPAYRVPSRTLPDHEVQFRYLFGAPEPSRMLQPVKLVDRKGGSQILLCGPDTCPKEVTGTDVSEECGLLLVDCGDQVCRLVDILTGLDVKLREHPTESKSASLHAFWGPRLRQ
jgi:hypothetical protein